MMYSFIPTYTFMHLCTLTHTHTHHWCVFHEIWGTTSLEKGILVYAESGEEELGQGKQLGLGGGHLHLSQPHSPQNTLCVRLFKRYLPDHYQTPEDGGRCPPTSLPLALGSVITVTLQINTYKNDFCSL